MISDNMSTGKATAVVGLGLSAMLVSQAQSWYPQWREAGLSGAPAWAEACIIAGLCFPLVARLYRLLFCPLELLRSPDDVGYIVEDGRTKAQAANEVRRRRKAGELPPIYPNGWYRVLDSHQLGRGEVKSVSLLGEQVVVFRDQDGKAHVLDAYCPHLGASLAVGGRVVGNCIECPFHGWQFQGDDGKCVKIPYAEKGKLSQGEEKQDIPYIVVQLKAQQGQRERQQAASLDMPEFAKVRHWTSCEVNGQIVVWFHCDGKDPEWTVPEQMEITKGEWVYRGRTEHFINAHIQEIPENAADIAHLAHLHTPGMVSGVDLRYINNKTWEFLRHDWKVRWEPEPEPNQHCSNMFVKHALTVFGLHWSLLDVNVVARQVGPGLVFLRFNHSFLGRGVMMHCVTPVEPLLQCVTHTMFYQASIPLVVPNFILKVESIQFERDVMIWNNKKYIAKPLLVKEDSAIQKHRRWFSQFYSKNSPRLQYQRDTLDF